MKRDTLNKIVEIRARIQKLPKGYISSKTIRGNVYYYHQWSENGIKYSKYVSEDQLVELNTLIEERQQLENELKLLKKGIDVSELLPCTLMHLDVEVIDIDIDIETGIIKTIGTTHSIEHLPIGALNNDNSINASFLREWWSDRSIPLSRSGIQEALEKLNIHSPRSLLIKCFGLSLSDQYWIRPRKDHIDWKDINFFDNDFSDDIGKILLGDEPEGEFINLSSPDNTSVGNLKKRWTIIDGKRVMIKGGSNPFRQEPFNEVIVSQIAKILHIPCVTYSLTHNNNYPYCECEDFINKDVDLVTAYQINKVLKKNNSDSTYIHFIKCCHELGLKDVEEYLSKLLVLDFIIANEDRHFNNFGFLRNAKTLEFIGPAPIYDSGASFGFDKLASDIFVFKNIQTKPFKTNPIEQLELVSSFKWLDVKALEDVKKQLPSLFGKYESKYLPKERITIIVDATIQRIDYLVKKI